MTENPLTPLHMEGRPYSDPQIKDVMDTLADLQTSKKIEVDFRTWGVKNGEWRFAVEYKVLATQRRVDEVFIEHNIDALKASVLGFINKTVNEG